MTSQMSGSSGEGWIVSRARALDIPSDASGCGSCTCWCRETDLLLPDWEQEGSWNSIGRPFRKNLATHKRIGIQSAEMKTSVNYRKV